MNRLAVFLADGFEEIEALTVVDICRRGGLTVDMVSIGMEKMVTGSHGILVTADKLFEDVNFEAYDMLVLPGGLPGTINLEAHKGLMEQVDCFFQEKRYLAAICAAPSIFGHRGILRGKKACCYPGYEDQLEGAEVTMGPVETDGSVITSRGMGTSMDFALAILETFCGQEAAFGLAKKTIWKES